MVGNMKKNIIILAIILIFLVKYVWAFEIITPEIKQYNVRNIATNFTYIKYKRVEIPTGTTNKIFDLGTTTSSVIIGTVNSNVTNYVTKIIPGINTCEVYLDSAASATLEVSLIGIIR